MECPAGGFLEIADISGEGLVRIGPCPESSEICPSLSCPADCSTNGRCLDGECQCFLGYAGEDCSKVCSSPDFPPSCFLDQSSLQLAKLYHKDAHLRRLFLIGCRRYVGWIAAQKASSVTWSPGTVRWWKLLHQALQSRDSQCQASTTGRLHLRHQSRRRARSMTIPMKKRQRRERRRRWKLSRSWSRQSSWADPSWSLTLTPERSRPYPG